MPSQKNKQILAADKNMYRAEFVKEIGTSAIERGIISVISNCSKGLCIVVKGLSLSSGYSGKCYKIQRRSREKIQLPTPMVGF